MAIACPVDLDTKRLRSEVSNVYSRVVAEPGGEFHFHRGPAYAAEFLGYDPAELPRYRQRLRRRSPALPTRTAWVQSQPGKPYWTSAVEQVWTC